MEDITTNAESKYRDEVSLVRKYSYGSIHYTEPDDLEALLKIEPDINILDKSKQDSKELSVEDVINNEVFLTNHERNSYLLNENNNETIRNIHLNRHQRRIVSVVFWIVIIIFLIIAIIRVGYYENILI